MSNLPYGGIALAAINAKSNRQKQEAYWLGFLKGILASEKIEDLELPALRAEAVTFLRLLNDDDAEEILRDLDTNFEDYNREIYSSIECIVEERSKHFVATSSCDALNKFFGFCAGIACDNRITLKEVERLIEAMDSLIGVVEDPRVQRFKAASQKAIADGKITDDEANDIASWICRLVGDSYTDTGLATYGNSPDLEGRINDFRQVSFVEKIFVITGAFMFAPRKVITASIHDLGGIVVENVSQRTDYLVVGSEASRDWKYSHQGTKLVAARELRRKFGRPHLIDEVTIQKALDTDAPF